MQNKVEHVEDTTGEPEGLIKTPRQLIITIFLAFVIPITVILLLVKLVAVTSPMGAGSHAQSTEAIAERIAPVAGFRLVEATSDNAGESRTGEQVYELTCVTCHATGVAGAPLFGDEAAWAPLIESGFDEMVRISIEGVGAMPPRGGNPALSDLEMARAVAYMANQAGGSFDEPTEEGAAETAATTPEATATPEAEPEATETAAEQATTDEPQQAAASTAVPDPAEVQQILTKNACLACHATDKKMIGPAYREVAEKYAGDASAADTIAQHIKQGSSGIWGPIPMPPNAGVSDDDLAKVVTWIMAGAPDKAAAAQPAEAPQEAAAPADAEAAEPEAAAEDDAATEGEAAAEAEATAEQAGDTPDEAQQAAAGTAAPDPAEVQQILTKNACLACHATDKKMIGPAYREVAEKYAGDAGAADTIAQHIKQGSSGIWGPIPMPPNAAITDDDLAKVVAWIMAGAPE